MNDWIPPGWSITQFIGSVGLGAVVYAVAKFVIGVVQDAAAKARK